jgi:ubiquinone/menaquinone biosynthesis C-methylase UbiE
MSGQPLQKNADRFSGFSALYDLARPQAPNKVQEILLRYLGKKPSLVVDLGCGTGLSTLMWTDCAEQVVGIEPSADMMRVAQEKGAHLGHLRFHQAFAHETGLPDASADLLTCSQSFHWMNPETTLREADRILKPGGVFAVYDCDWPPVCLWEAEQAYVQLFDFVHEHERVHKATKDSFVRWDKDQHLANLNRHGRFRYVREIVFSNTESCDANRFIAIALSQGGLQALLRAGAKGLEQQIEFFEQAVRTCFGEQTVPLDFCYRMRVGVK